jgi:hypothetical protein
MAKEQTKLLWKAMTRKSQKEQFWCKYFLLRQPILEVMSYMWEGKESIVKILFVEKWTLIFINTASQVPSKDLLQLKKKKKKNIILEDTTKYRTAGNRGTQMKIQQLLLENEISILIIPMCIHHSCSKIVSWFI